MHNCTSFPLPTYLRTLEDLGLNLQAGEPVRLQGCREHGEFKGAQVTRLQAGQTVTLRAVTCPVSPSVSPTRTNDLMGQ